MASSEERPTETWRITVKNLTCVSKEEIKGDW